MGWLRMAGWVLGMVNVAACGGIVRHSGPDDGPDAVGGSSSGGTNAVGGGGYGAAGVPGTNGCSYQGKSYPNGSKVTPAGCTCTCNRGEITCPSLPCDLTTCEYNGAVYEPGDTFTASDGCNICKCENGGSLSCTKTDCPNPDTCKVLDQDYSVYLDAANRCTSDAQCSESLPSSVWCGCPMWVNAVDKRDVQLALQTQMQFQEKGCFVNVICPSCAPLQNGRCLAGRCSSASGIQ